MAKTGFHEFNTETWAKTIWRTDAVPLQGYLLNPTLKPMTPVFPDKPYHTTGVNFERVIIDLKGFLTTCLSRLVNEALSKKTESKDYILLLTFALLGHVSTKSIEVERKYSAMKVRKLKASGAYSIGEDGSIHYVNFAKIPQEFDGLPDSEIWTKALPLSVTRAFLPILHEPTPTAALKHQIERSLSGLVEPYSSGKLGDKKFDAAFGKKLERAMSSGALDKAYTAVVAGAGWRYLHQELEKSALNLAEAIGRYGKGQLAARDATLNYLTFWYTSQGPWKENLKGFTPALGEAIPSIYSEMDPAAQEQFDHSAFVLGQPPPRTVLNKLLVNSLTHASTIDGIRTAESQAKYRKRFKKNPKVKDRIQRVDQDKLRFSTKQAIGEDLE